MYYHGSNSQDIDNFRPSNAGHINAGLFGNIAVTRHGIFLSNSKDFASEYGSHIYSVMPTIHNTANVELVKQDFVESLDPFEERDLWLLARASKHPWGLFDGKLGEKFVQCLKSSGFDSATFEEDLPADATKTGTEKLSKTLVVFDPKNVRILR